MPLRNVEIKKSFVSSVQFTGGTRLISKNSIRRRIWLVTIFVACIALSVHLYYCCDQYTAYEVNTLVENHEFSFEFPDVTICSTVPFSRKKVENEGRKSVLVSAQQFWHRIMNYSDSVDDVGRSYSEAILSFQSFSLERDIYSGILDNTYHCKYKGHKCNKKSFSVYGTSDRVNCVTFSPDDRYILVPSKRGGFHIILSIGDGFTENDPASDLQEAVGFEVIINQKGALPQTNKDLVVVEPGKQVVIELTMKNYTRLSTRRARCFSEKDVEKFIKNNVETKSNFKKFTFTNTFTENDCLPIVLSNLIIEQCQCRFEGIKVPWTYNSSFPNCFSIPREFFFNDRIDENGTLFYKNETYNIFNNETVNQLISRSKCIGKVLGTINKSSKIKSFLSKECPNRCTKTQYVKDIMFTKWPKSINQTFATLNMITEKKNSVTKKVPKLIEPDEIKSMVSIIISPSELSVDGTSESLAYPLSQLLADFGGNIGLWIGCSILTLAELVEFLVRVFVQKHRSISKKHEEVQHELTGDDNGLEAVKLKADEQDDGNHI